MLNISENAIRKSLKFPVPEIIILDSVDSTNNYLKKLTEENIKEGTIVIARRQTKGRGRTGNSFFSPDGGLYMSILLDSGLNTEFVTALSGVSVCHAIEKCTELSPKIKWVNDIYIDRKKICGILAEGTVSPVGKLENIILGIGLNILAPKGGFPEDIKDKAGALYEYNMPKDAENRITAEIINSLFQIVTEKSNKFIDEYKKLSLLTGKEIEYKKNNILYTGRVISIDDKLRLVIETPSGEKDILSSGEIKIINWE